MTTGQILFYGGAALLGLTVILAIIFTIKKPKYNPESAVYAETDPGRTHSLRNGYPTDRMTIRREPIATEPNKQSQETELLAETLSEPVPSTERLQKTDLLEPQDIEVLTDPQSDTEQLRETSLLETKQTAVLTEDSHS